MNKKPLAVLAGVIAFVVGAYVTRQTTDLIRREPGVAKDLLGRVWIEQSIGPGFRFDAPWPLQPQTMQLPPEVERLIAESSSTSHEEDGLNVMAMHMTFVPGIPTNLEGAADGAIENLRAVPGTQSVEGSKSEVSVAGERAFQLEASIKRERGVPLHMRGLVFGDSPHLYQVITICREDQPAGAAIWEKLRSSVRRTAA